VVCLFHLKSDVLTSQTRTSSVPRLTTTRATREPPRAGPKHGGAGRRPRTCDTRAVCNRSKSRRFGVETRRGTERALGCLTVGRLLEIHVGVSEGAPGDHVATHTDGQDWSRRRELLVQHGLGHVLVQVADVERRHGVAGPGRIHGGAGRPTYVRFLLTTWGLVQAACVASSRSRLNSYDAVSSSPASAPTTIFLDFC